MAEAEVGESTSLEYTPTWIVAVLCSIIVIICLLAERGLHHLGKCLKRRNQDALYEALQKLQEELMLLGFVSLLLTVCQRMISKICIPTHLTSYMLPCKRKETSASTAEHFNFNFQHLLSEDIGTQHCAIKGKVPLVSVEGLHQLHIFIFVLAVVHVIFCATTMVLGVAKTSEWKRWEDSIKSIPIERSKTSFFLHAQIVFTWRAMGHYRKLPVVRWIVSFLKQLCGPVTRADYIALRSGFIREHRPSHPDFDFYKYMLLTLEHDFKRIVGIRWYLWLFVVVFLLLNISGWYTFFWLSFLPIILLLFVGAHLEHIITRLARDLVEKSADAVKPSDHHFWCHNPKIIIYLIHFILFQNSFEIAFFFWVWTTHGFESCIMEKKGYIITKLVIGALVQVLCSYRTFPLYAIVSQMGSMFKLGLFIGFQRDSFNERVDVSRQPDSTSGVSDHSNRLENQPMNDERITMDQENGTLQLSSCIDAEEQV